MPHERMTSTDAAFLHIESDHEPQHVGSLAVIDGAGLRDAEGRIPIDELRAFVSGRLHRVPRLRQRVMPVPGGVGHPVWVDDERFDIDYHVRLTALPRPGNDRQLCELFSRLQSLPLDRRRPLWEMWIVDGLADDHVGLVIKAHHAMGDGIANVELVLALIDIEPDPAPDPPGPQFVPRPAPSAPALLADSIADALLRPLDLARGAVGLVRRPGDVAATLRNTAQALIAFQASTRPAPWNLPVTTHRRWEFAEVPIERVRAIRDAAEATINDVVLAACTEPLRDYLLARGEDVAGRSLKAMVPVSRRADDEHGTTLGNRVSLVVADLPVGIADPIARIAHIREQTSALKSSGIAAGVETLATAAGELTMLAGPLSRALTRSVPMNLVITNIPGPPVPLYVRGSRVLRAYPYVEVVDNEGLTIAALSYDNRLFFGITADRDVMPDLRVVAEGIEASLDRLADAFDVEPAPA